MIVSTLGASSSPDSGACVDSLKYVSLSDRGDDRGTSLVDPSPSAGGVGRKSGVNGTGVTVPGGIGSLMASAGGSEGAGADS